MSDDIFAALDGFDTLLPPLPAAESEGLQGELTTVEAVRNYVRGGKATVTIQSKGTGTRFTFKISKATGKGPAAFMVGLLTGPDNESNYQYIGIVRNDVSGERFTLTKKSRITRDAVSYKAFEFFWRAIVVQQRSPERWGMKVWHEGHCGRCGRALTVPESIASGFGPECIKHIH